MAWIRKINIDYLKLFRLLILETAYIEFINRFITKELIVKNEIKNYNNLLLIRRLFNIFSAKGYSISRRPIRIRQPIYTCVGSHKSQTARKKNKPCVNVRYAKVII